MLFQCEMIQRCPISALRVSCGGQDNHYINTIFEAWILHKELHTKHRESASSLGKLLGDVAGS